MRLSLPDEQASREAASQQLQAAQAELQAREQNLARLQSDRPSWSRPSPPPSRA